MTHHVHPTPEAAVQKLLEEYGGTKVNAAHFICDRHTNIPERIALFYETASGESSKWTFRELTDLSQKLAGFLREAGIGKGDRVAAMLPKCPELLITALAVWRLGATYVPLFTAFGPDAIDYRVLDSGCKMVVTNGIHRPKISKTKAYEQGALEVVTITDALGKGLAKGDYSFWSELEAGSPVKEVEWITGDALMILLYTSGTTGTPKGVEVPIKALASFETYMRFGLDLREDDVYWNMADPGWAYGLYYNLIGAMLIGKGTLFFNAPFDPSLIYKILEKYRVTNFASAPTAYRALKAQGLETARKHRFSIRCASSAGEPLNPEVIEWFHQLWGVQIHDQYGQTELGMAANNHHHPAAKRPIKLGSMGPSMPGFRMVVVDDNGNELGPGEEGHFAVDTHNSPLMWFHGYWNAPDKTAEKFVGGGRYYLTGDTVSRDEDGYFYFSGRSDDIILSAGYRIGPFEVESAIMKHPAVAEVAVVGVPDELRGEVVKAYVVLKRDYRADQALAEEIKQFVKSQLSAHEYPREIEFTDQLPKTPSGKVQRFLLRK
uniref:AMP-dependent synthetase n=1 Tax=Desulfacinum infernum TaxID=35837 RepID=A0A832A1X6_9BACT